MAAELPAAFVEPQPLHLVWSHELTADVSVPLHAFSPVSAGVRL
ncbi:hypothetical protein [Embleya sp. MST-111070]